MRFCEKVSFCDSNGQGLNVGLKVAFWRQKWDRKKKNWTIVSIWEISLRESLWVMTHLTSIYFRKMFVVWFRHQMIEKSFGHPCEKKTSQTSRSSLEPWWHFSWNFPITEHIQWSHNVIQQIPFINEVKILMCSRHNFLVHTTITYEHDPKSMTISADEL